MANKKIGNRDARQKAEGYETVKTGLAEDRFQGSKQVLNPDELGGANAPTAGNASGDVTGTKAKILKAKISVRPDVSVETLDGKQVGGVPLESAGVTRSAAGFGGGASVSDDISKIPYQQGGYRPNTRYGKKRSEDLFELDNTVTEQIIYDVEDSLDLRQAPDAKQGYNGRKQFKEVRSKKNTRGGPQGLLFNASNDINFHNFTVATSGQMLAGMDARAGYPTITYGSHNEVVDGETITVDGNYALPNDRIMRKANYLLEGFDFDIVDGRIANVRFRETEYTPNGPSVVRDQANHNWQVDMNYITKSMIRMQTELGRETTDKWSPLGYVIEQPYQFNSLMHDIEATTGAICYAAYRSAVASLAYQRNIISKDGIGPAAAAVRMFAEGTDTMVSRSSSMDGVGIDRGVWNRALYNRGSAAAIVRMFDSPSKYRTKADFLGMQRSLTLHLSQADNNINPFRMKAQFAKAFDKCHLFSTEDGNYNPALPIHATKKIHIINPLSLNAFLTGWRHPGTASQDGFAVEGRSYETGTVANYRYNYTDLRNRYTWDIRHPIVEGLLAWLLRHEAALVSVYGNGAHVHLPASFDMVNPSMFQFMVCSATQLIALKRNVIFRDVLFAGEQSTYIWDDLTAIKDIDPLHATQLNIGGYDSPLKVGKMSADTVLRVMWSDHMPVLDVDTSNINEKTIALPWYFNEMAMGTPDANGFTEYDAQDFGFFAHGDESFAMSIPSIRQGVRHAFVDTIKSMSESDIRLSLDRFLDVPCRTTVNPAGNTVASAARAVVTDPSGRNYVRFAALRYDQNSDGRVVMNFRDDGQFTEDAVFTIPKEVGFIWNTPSSLIPMASDVFFNAENQVQTEPCFSYPVELPNTNDGVNTDGYFSADAPYHSNSAVLVRSYRVFNDADNARSLDRSAALTQVSFTAHSSPAYHYQNEQYTRAIGLALSSSYADNGVEVITTALVLPRTNDNAAAAMHVTGIPSYARYMWTLLQRHFYPVNPFEMAYDSIATIDNPVDPLEATFYFGLCGFLASDYTQAVLERLDTFDQLGLDYTEDVNSKESLIFR